jgi:hypothetical protein
MSGVKAGFAKLELYAGDSHGFGYALIFVEGKERHREFRDVSDPDIRLSGSGFLTRDGALGSAASIASGINIKITNKTAFKDEIQALFD